MDGCEDNVNSPRRVPDGTSFTSCSTSSTSRCFYSRETHCASPVSSRGTPPHAGKVNDDLGDQTFFMDDYVKNAMKVR